MANISHSLTRDVLSGQNSLSGQHKYKFILPGPNKEFCCYCKVVLLFCLLEALISLRRNNNFIPLFDTMTDEGCSTTRPGHVANDINFLLFSDYLLYAFIILYFSAWVNEIKTDFLPRKMKLVSVERSTNTQYTRVSSSLLIHSESERLISLACEENIGFKNLK